MTERIDTLSRELVYQPVRTSITRISAVMIAASLPVNFIEVGITFGAYYVPPALVRLGLYALLHGAGWCIILGAVIPGVVRYCARLLVREMLRSTPRQR